MASFYKMDPAVWDAATAMLTLEEEAACLRICNANYKAERGCPDHPPMLAGMFRCSTRKARALVESLVQKGKVKRRSDGLWSDRSEREINEIQKKRSEKTPKTSRNGDETPANGSRNASETPTNASRNANEQTDNPLISGETTHANQPHREDKTRQDESRKDFKKNAFEAFWKSYPRRRQECGSLTRGSKQLAEEHWNKLSSGERDLAIQGLPGFTRLYPDDSKAVCDAVRYLSKKRWRDVEGLEEKPAEFIPYPDGALGEKVRRFAELIGIDRYKSYFVREGESIFAEDEDGQYLQILSDFHAERIKSKCLAELKSVFGKDGLRFVVVKRKAA